MESDGKPARLGTGITALTQCPHGSANCVACPGFPSLSEPQFPHLKRRLEGSAAPLLPVPISMTEDWNAKAFLCWQQRLHPGELTS